MFKELIGSYKHIIFLTILALIGLVLFWKTFQLEIFGDEWEGVWWTTSTLQRTGHFNDRVDYKPYELAATLLNIVSGASSLTYNSTAVYIFSFLTRLLSSYSLYYFFIRRKFSLVTSFMGALIFLITPIGIQATDWAKNFTSYISIAFFLISIDTIFNLNTRKKIFSFLIALSLAIYINPIRAHGIILTILSLLLFQLVFQKGLQKRNIIIALGGLILMFIFFSRMMIFGNTNIAQVISLSSIRLRDLPILIGRGVMPNPTFIYISLFTVALLSWKRYLLDRKYLLFSIPLHVIFFFLIFYRWSSTEDLNSLVGVYFVLFLISSFLIEISQQKFTSAFYTMIPLLLNICFVILPWLLGRTDITDSTHRYLIYSALSLPIIIVSSLHENYFNNTKKHFSLIFSIKAVGFYLLPIYLLALFISTKSAINDMYLHHNQKDANIIWQQIRPYFDKFDFQKHTPILLFDSDNEPMLHDTVLFGLGYHMGYIYKIWDYNKLPIPLDGPETLKSMLTDGKASKRYLGNERVFPKQDAFYFKIKGLMVSRIDISDSFIKNGRELK